MKKVMVLLAMCCLVLGGCSSGVSKEEYDKVVAERDQYKAQLESLNSQATDSQTQESEKKGEQSPKLSATELSNRISVKEYSYTDSINTAWYIMEVTNNSPVTVSIETNVTAKDAQGAIVGASSASEDAIEPGYSVVLTHMLDNCEPASYEYALSAQEDKYYKPVMSDLSYEASDTGQKVIVTCTNNGKEDAEFVEGAILFFSGDKLVRHDRTYFVDNDSKLKAGNTIANEFNSYSETGYDNYKIYFTGRK